MSAEFAWLRAAFGDQGEARELLEDMLLWARADGEKFKALFDAQIAWAALQRATGGL